jgi:hypothetical protein
VKDETLLALPGGDLERGTATVEALLLSVARRNSLRSAFRSRDRS